MYRGYKTGDARAMFALDEVCFDEPFRFSLRTMRRFAEADNAIVWLAFNGEALAGFAIGHVEDGGVYLVTLDVAPGWRRQGIAAELVRRVERVACSLELEAAFLHVYCGNLAGIGFYERLGYQRLGVVPGFYGAGLDGAVYRRGLGGG